MRIEQARQPDDRLRWGDLLAQTLAQRLLVALRALLGGAVVAIEEVPLTLQIFEYPQVVVARLPAVGHEDEDWIGLRHGWQSRTSAPAGKLALFSPRPEARMAPCSESSARLSSPTVRLLVYNIRYATGTGPAFHLAVAAQVARAGHRQVEGGSRAGGIADV